MDAAAQGLAEELLIAFVPKSDPKARRLLATREDVFPDYAREGFERAIAPRFETLVVAALRGSGAPAPSDAPAAGGRSPSRVGRRADLILRQPRRRRS